MASAKEKIRHSVFRTVLWIRLGNVIVPVGIRHSVVQIAVESTVMHPVVRVTVKKELRPISPYLKGCHVLRHPFRIFYCFTLLACHNLINLFSFPPFSLPWAIRKGNATGPAGNRHSAVQRAVESTAKHPVGRETAKKGVSVSAVVEPLSIAVMCTG